MGKIHAPNITEKFARIRQESMDRLDAELLDTALTHLPVEDGHAHEAFIASHEHANLPQKDHISRVLVEHGNNRSGDKTAKKAGRGKYRESKHRSRLSIQVKLPFVKKLEEGGVLKPVKPGAKKEGIATMGELYAPRFSKGNRGVLLWLQGGKLMYRKVRKVPPHGFLAAAIQAVNQLAHSLGWRNR